MSVYERLGVDTVINAVGPATRLSGGLMREEVAAAMREASQACVEIVDLQAKASEIIAAHTGAEAGYVTAGASAALLLGTAACVAGLDPSKMNRLPDTTGMKRDVLITRSQRNFYDHAVRAVGVTLREVGIADRFSGAGVRDAEAWEFEAAIDEHTAAILYVAQPWSRPSLESIIAVSRPAGVPVLVDAAAQLPPASNLRRFIDAGADLVAISGGKAIGGPQSSGLLFGRRDLVASAALQNLDMDVLAEQWTAPGALFSGLNLPGLPQHGIGRSCKVGKEEIVGLLRALELFIEEGDEVRWERWLGLMQTLTDGLADVPCRAVRLLADRSRAPIPTVELEIDEPAAKMSALDLIARLQRHKPRVHASPARADEGIVTFAPLCLKTEHPAEIVTAVRTLLAGARRV